MGDDNSMTDRSLREQLDAISQIERATKRGLELESLTAELFRQYHFNVIKNPGTARPRQTDVLAIRGTEAYLIECKWRSDKANINDIDSLRSRLRRTSGGVVGLLISFRGFSQTVLADVESHRDQPVLLVSGDELQTVVSGLRTLSGMLWQKKQALLVDGRVILDEPVQRASNFSKSGLPHNESYYLTTDGNRSHVIEFGGEYGQTVFAHRLPDIDWVPAVGHGVTLDVEPPVFDQEGLHGLLSTLADLGWISSEGRWSVRQAARTWHGLGFSAFVEELKLWKSRASSASAHHSEEVCYVDRCDGGFYTVTANVAAHEVRRTTMTGVSFQLQGIPLDTEPLLQLCRTLGAHDGLYFRPRAEKSIRRHLMSPTTIDIQPVAYLVSRDPDDRTPHAEWVTGVVVANPFRGISPAGQRGQTLLEQAGELASTEDLICDLIHHHPFGGSGYTYKLVGLDLSSTSHATVCRPFADWVRST
ncbi:restriction endonuclease [Flindersiella endophytica]